MSMSAPTSLRCGRASVHVICTGRIVTLLPSVKPNVRVEVDSEGWFHDESFKSDKGIRAISMG